MLRKQHNPFLWLINTYREWFTQPYPGNAKTTNVLYL
jgi:hypothetical protein